MKSFGPDLPLHTTNKRIAELDALLRTMKQQLFWANEAAEKHDESQMQQALDLIATTASRVVRTIRPETDAQQVKE